jgi:CRP-like cAMP-binding protein
MLEETADYISTSPLVFAFASRGSTDAQQRQQILNLAKYFKQVEFEEGEPILKEGDVADRFYIIAEGRVTISVATESGEKPLCEKASSDFFGETGMHLDKKTYRTASVTAREFTLCLVITKKAFKDYISQASKECAEKLQMVMGRSMEKTLRSIPMLSHVSVEDLKLLGSMVQYRILNQNEILFKKGEMGSDFFIVYSGTVSALGAQNYLCLKIINRPSIVSHGMPAALLHCLPFSVLSLFDTPQHHPSRIITLETLKRFKKTNERWRAISQEIRVKTDRRCAKGDNV